MTPGNAPRLLAAALALSLLTGCFGGLKRLKVNDMTDGRVADLSLTKKVIGKGEFLFFSTTRAGVFLEGAIQGVVTDYAGNPIEGVTVRAVADKGEKGVGEGGGEAAMAAVEENAGSFVNLSFAPGISDSMGLYKLKFSLPIVDDEVDIRGKLIYNPGWDQQKLNLGKAYEPQTKESPFRLYYNIDTGFLAFAEGVRKIIVQPVGEGRGRLQNLPGQAGPQQPAPAQGQPAQGQQPAQSGEEDLFKGFDFGQ